MQEDSIVRQLFAIIFYYQYTIYYDRFILHRRMNHKLFIIFSCLLGSMYIVYATIEHGWQTANDTIANTQVVSHLQIVSPYVVDIPTDAWSRRWGGMILVKDYCPDGDKSLSFYDRTCDADDRDVYSIDDMHYIAPMSQVDRLALAQNKWITYRELAHIIWWVLIRYHPDVNQLLLSQRISSMHEGVQRIVKLYNIPRNIDTYVGNTLITQRNFIYFIITLRHITQKPVNLNPQIHTNIDSLRGYMRYDTALYLIEKYGF